MTSEGGILTHAARTGARAPGRGPARPDTVTMHPKNIAHEPPTEWGGLGSVHDECDALEALFADPPVIDESETQPLRRRFQAA